MILGIDIGGTHTDAVCLSAGEIIATAKVRTGTDLVASIIAAIQGLSIDHAELKRVVLSTTLSTNAIVEKKYARTGMIVAAGPGLDPQAYFLSDDFFLVEGAIDHRGREYIPLRTSQIQDVAREIEARGIREVGVVSKFSVRNPAHELAVHGLIERDFLHITLGHQMSGTLNFPRRIHTTYFNSAVMPIQEHFVRSVKQALRELGIRARLLFLKADGGTYSSYAADRLPVETILSGPAASMMGAVALGRGDACTLVLDIGGTTTDMGILIGGYPILEPRGISVDGLKTLVRGLKMRSIGAGGDSLVRVEAGVLRVGPQREGPPACLGGSSPTPMDALCCLGELPIGDKQRAAQAISGIAAALGRDLPSTARDVVATLTATIRAAAQDFIREVNTQPVYTIQEMLHPELVTPVQAIIIGAPAATLKSSLEAALCMPCIVPEHAAVANAMGAALAKTTAQITVLADTQQQRFICPELDINEVIPITFTLDEVRVRGIKALWENAIYLGLTDDADIDVVESQSFNMVSGFRTVGRNMRLKLQTRPGILKGW